MATERILHRLDQSRISQGLSWRQLAKDLGITHSYLSQLHHGIRPLTSSMRVKVGRWLKRKPSATLLAAFEGFLNSPAHRSSKTIETLRERLAPFVAFLTERDVSDPLDITVDHVSGFLRYIVAGRRGGRLSAASEFGFTKDVSAFLNYVGKTLAPEDWKSPAKSLVLRHPNVVIQPLSSVQVDTLLSVAEPSTVPVLKNLRNRVLLYVLLDGALRVGELLSAQRTMLNEEGVLRVLGKGGKEREVALSPRTIAAIHDYSALRADNCPGLIATDEGTPMTYSAVKSLFHRWRQAAPEVFVGVRLSAHTLRHTSATMRRIAGMSEGDLQTFLGHASPVMTRHYSALALAKSANAAARKTSPIDGL